MTRRSLVPPLALAGLLAAVSFAAPGAPPEAPGKAPAAAIERERICTGTLLSGVTGRPLPGGVVEAYEQTDPEAMREKRLQGLLLPDPISRATADSLGRFAIVVPSGGRVYLVAGAEGHARSRLGRPFSAAADRDLGIQRIPAGRRITGKVVDGAGKPLAGAAVMTLSRREEGMRGGGFARGWRDRELPSFPALARTGAGGTFILDGVPRRAVDLRAWAEGHAPTLIEDQRGAGPATIAMASGSPLSGRVVAPDGKTPIAGAWVLAGEEGWDGIARSAPDGAFTLASLRSGSHEIVASAPASASGEAAFFAPSSALRVAVPRPQKAVPAAMRLRAGGIVRARVIDAESREPIEDTYLTLVAPGERRPRASTTGAKGETVFTGVPVGSVGLRAEADGYFEEDLESLSLAAGKTRDVSIALRAAAAVEGTVRDREGQPIAGATVSVLGPPPRPIPLPVTLYFPIGVDPTTTDLQGAFRLERLPARTDLRFTVAASGFAPWDLAGVKLLPGERRKGMEILLDAGVTISGRAVDVEGKPVTGASVTAARRLEGGAAAFTVRIGPGGGGGRRGGLRGAGGEEDLPSVLTDAEGRFRVRGAQAGIWSVEVDAAGFAPRSVAGLKIEDDRGIDAGDIVLEPGARIEGRVLARSGEPVPYARGIVRKGFEFLSELVADGAGVFASGDLVPGEPVDLAIDVEGYAAVERAGLVPPISDLVVTLQPSSAVGGRVVDAEARKPIPDFGIAVSRSRSGGGAGARMRMEIAGPETAFHDEDGSFLVEDVDPGKVTVAARAPGYRPSVLRDIDVPEAGDVEGLLFALDRAASISGAVVDERQRPIAGAAVEKKDTSASGGGRLVRGGGSATTDGDGRFLLDGLERGPMTITAGHPDYETADADVDTTRDIEGLRIVLSRGATLAGRVVLEEDGSPVGGATVTLTAAGGDSLTGSRSATSTPEGTFAVEGLPPGRYALRAEAAGLRPNGSDEVVIVSGVQPPPQEIRLAGGVTLAGTITGVREQDLPQFTVRAVGEERGGFGKTAAVDASGRFEMKGLAPGGHTLIAASGIFGGRSMAKAIRIPEGVAMFETSVEFPRGNVVEGTVRRRENPLAGASVIFMSAAARTTSTGTTDAEGRYKVEYLEEGEYSVAVMQFSASLSHQTTLTVRGDERFDIDLPLARVAGSVRDGVSLRPLDEAEITVERADGAAISPGRGMLFRRGARSDTSGFWEVDGLDDGLYRITARRDGYGFQSRQVRVIPGAEAGDVVFDLARVDSLAFRVLDGVSGLPLRSVRALVVSENGGDPFGSAVGAPPFLGTLSADGSGLFRIETLPPGAYRIVLGGGGVATVTVHDVQVPAAERTITMPRGGSLEIRCAGLASGEVARAVLLDEGGRPVHVNTFRADPWFVLQSADPASLEDLPPGAYRLRAALPQGGIVEKPVVVGAGSKTPATIP